MAAPKKKRLKLIIIIVLSRVVADLDSDIETGINFDMDATFSCSEMVALMNKDETTWDGAEDAVFDAADILGGALEGSSKEPDIETAYADLEAAIAGL